MDGNEALAQLRKRIGETATPAVADEILGSFPGEKDLADLLPAILHELYVRLPERRNQVGLKQLLNATEGASQRCRDILRLHLLGRTNEEMQDELNASSSEVLFTWEARCLRSFFPGEPPPFGRYALDLLTDEEKMRRFETALSAAEPFSALVREHSWKEMFNDPSARAAILEAAGQARFSIRDGFSDWLDRPRSKVLLAVIVLLLIAIAIRWAIECA